MLISSVKLLSNENEYGITIGSRFNGELKSLNNIVILTGGNGSGKSRFLKLLYSSLEKLKKNRENNDMRFKISKKNKDTDKVIEIELTKETANSINVINYSHFDAKLQPAENFSPYVIHQSRHKLKQCNYEETALNSLLYLKDLVEGYSEESNETNDYKELIDFIKFAKELELEFAWNKDTKSLKIFNRSLDDAKLSPGQLYALRIAVACNVHETSGNNIFLLDEPEIHLHPSLLIKIVNRLMSRFQNSQFFIATHSLPLISYLTVKREDVTVLYMESGEIKDRLRSNSEPILNNLIGTEDEQFAVRQLFVSSEEMACNKFCMECFLKPTKVKGGTKSDPSVSMAENSLDLSNDSVPVIIVDYGAGEGRLLECMLEDDIKSGYKYYAYNIEKEDYEYCKELIKSKGIPGESYIDKEKLSKLNGWVDRVFLINVLHEISPESWKDVFSTISKLLKDDGKLVIIEREILTMGEAPNSGFLMLTGYGEKSIAAEKLFGESNVTFTRYEHKPYIISYTVKKSGVDFVKNVHLSDVLSVLESNAMEQIHGLKKQKNSLTHIEKYKNGLNLAFWLNQLSSAIIYKEILNSKEEKYV